VYPGEVEEVLLAYPGIVEAAVIGVPHQEHGEEIVALVVASHDHLDLEDVRTFARERLAAYKYPRHVIRVAALPKGPTGKIVKRAIDRADLGPAFLAAPFKS
jgi:long-chain acyl-CoA synthetase